jgi:hypothetical protein
MVFLLRIVCFFAGHLYCHIFIPETGNVKNWCDRCGKIELKHYNMIFFSRNILTRNYKKIKLWLNMNIFWKINNRNNAEIH